MEGCALFKRTALLLALLLLAGCTARPVPAPPPSQTDRPADKTPAPTPHTPAPAQKLPPHPLQLAFWDAQHGLMTVQEGCPDRCTLQVQRTDDGGKSWRTVHQAGSRSSAIAVTGTSHAWVALGTCQQNGGDACLWSILRTQDGGESWTEQDEAVEALSFSTRERGWGLSIESGNLMETTDGGKSWTALQVPCPAKSGSIKDAQRISATDGWALCVGQPGGGQQPRALLKTTDGGKTWHSPGEMGWGGYGQELFFLPDSRGYLLMSRSYSLITEDGGRTWREFGLTEPEVIEAHSIWFTDGGKTGFALLRDNDSRQFRLVRTDDSGGTWHDLHKWSIDP